MKVKNILKKTKIEANTKNVTEQVEKPVKTQKEIYLDLYNTLKALNVNSISDLENLISRS